MTAVALALVTMHWGGQAIAVRRVAIAGSIGVGTLATSRRSGPRPLPPIPGAPFELVSMSGGRARVHVPEGATATHVAGRRRSIVCGAGMLALSDGDTALVEAGAFEISVEAFSS